MAIARRLPWPSTGGRSSSGRSSASRRPCSREYLEWYARTLGNLGLLMAEKGDPAGAVPILTDAVTRAERLAELVPEEKGALDNLGACREQPGRDPDRRGPSGGGDPRPERGAPGLPGPGPPVSRRDRGPLGRRDGPDHAGRGPGPAGPLERGPAPSRGGRDHVRGAPKRLPDDPELKGFMQKHRNC